MMIRKKEREKRAIDNLECEDWLFIANFMEMEKDGYAVHTTGNKTDSELV